MQHLGAGSGQFKRFARTQSLNEARVRHTTRVPREHSVDIRPDFKVMCPHHGSQERARRVASSAP